MSTPLNVLFLCTGNSARSILAEALMNRLGQGRFRAYSAGSMPRGEINPHSRPLVRELGFEAEAFRSKLWDEFASPGAPGIDFMITVCDNAAGEVCPIWPGGPMTAHWGIPDPAEATGSDEDIAVAFRQAARRLSDRIELLLALPLDALDRVSLQRELGNIGAITDTASA